MACGDRLVGRASALLCCVQITFNSWEPMRRNILGTPKLHGTSKQGDTSSGVHSMHSRSRTRTRTLEFVSVPTTAATGETPEAIREASPPAEAATGETSCGAEAEVDDAESLAEI
eukprot:TRINITY_DN9549_c0_g1_i1.p2 TRINITY_DN9549_c0_g1~~TRINITY_DN9549_c0_g1_i1.p2  ORF type:complete len:115 (+),score=5.52 TRINITY_DN9549_c0_g1_i1:151-495(+)